MINIRSLYTVLSLICIMCYNGFSQDTLGSSFYSKLYRLTTVNMNAKMQYNQISKYQNRILNKLNCYLPNLDTSSFILMDFRLDSVSFIDTAYQLIIYNCSKLFYQQHSDKEFITIGSSVFSCYSPLMDIGMVAVRKNNSNDILFLSGYLFLDDYAHLFFNQKIDSVLVSNYIKIRYYNYQISEVQIREDEEKNAWIIDVNSQAVNKFFRIHLQYADGKASEAIEEISQFGE